MKLAIFTKGLDTKPGVELQNSSCFGLKRSIRWQSDVRNAPNHIINASVIIFTLHITDVETFNNNASAVKI